MPTDIAHGHADVTYPCLDPTGASVGVTLTAEDIATLAFIGSEQPLGTVELNELAFVTQLWQDTFHCAAVVLDTVLADLNGGGYLGL